MYKFNQELIDVLMRCRSVKKRESKAASLSTKTGINKAQMIHDFINGKH
jgi:hypothetical protein